MSPLDVAIAYALFALSALAFVVWVRQALCRARRDRRVEEAASVGAGPGDDYLGEWECRGHACDRAASVWVVYQPFGTRMFVCHKCAHDGAALGWFQLAS